MSEKIKQFYEDVIRELKKVSWPDKDQIISSSFVVVVITVVFTTFIYAADMLISSLVNLLY
ncbi:MAG: preprotein translocase subunit SecE [Calditrichia bacterium]|nr:preprotein translocase subunit SecE [Calditrichota bacterium]MCB0270129.1 preprotein translocase subunit SecE [Calditrichota bacterium]MCB9067053.1 preprotein translocase subunit SecE [Calditrichia bacterium]